MLYEHHMVRMRLLTFIPSNFANIFPINPKITVVSHGLMQTVSIKYGLEMTIRPVMELNKVMSLDRIMKLMHLVELSVKHMDISFATASFQLIKTGHSIISMVRKDF